MSSTRFQNGVVSYSLDVYLREIRAESLLTAVEERSLANAIANGDKDARTRMIASNLRLVVSIARNFMGRGLPLDDLIAEGNVGLIRASKEFQVRFGTRFCTYATYWIKHSIRHALINTTSMIRLPAHMVQLLTRWRRAERLLCREQGNTPSFDDVATALGLSEARKTLVANALQALYIRAESSVILETGRACREDSWNFQEASLQADDERRILLQRMKRLEKRERTILELRYGLKGEGPLTLKEIGIRLGATRRWVRKIELRALRKLGDNAGHTGKALGNALGRDPSVSPQRAGSITPTPTGRGRPQALVMATRSPKSPNGTHEHYRTPISHPGGLLANVQDPSPILPAAAGAGITPEMFTEIWQLLGDYTADEVQRCEAEIGKRVPNTRDEHRQSVQTSAAVIC
jgi:RNA polymerase primary sigma factor